ncbi:MAG: AfsR/SARP family transcriptional regulator, partial [Thermoanaerobaculia bacterium]
MPLLRLDMLGDFQMHSASGELVTLSARKSQALLAFLGVKPTQLVSREKIANLLWSSTGPEQARQSLRQLLSSLRKELLQISPKQKILVEESDFLRLDPAAITSDVTEFESMAGSGTDEALAA